ncbi:cell division protein ZapE [Miniimonas arenae]|uniref:Cell division protein ZapE n=1 Tax=Miniimonas arenae TaxID=676201 RepID=A0A5C5BDJ2_9MICO|nr:cell division protein ZapE [Miniimonas arenae]TNU76073.1 cell division protein ZapE [Miniimonas arenae]
MPDPAHPISLTDRLPEVTAAQLLAGLVPPPQFARASFDSYVPDPAHPSQAQARERMRDLAARIVEPPRKGLFRKAPPPPASLYLDGGYGVGKTHLLASLAHAVGPERSAYGTFVEYTHLVGAVGFRECVAALSDRALVAIDEFELDDPGDTVLMSRLLRELADAGVTLVATSNTLPEALGEGRFAAEDFLREIQALAARFEVMRIDGEDYRLRDGRPERTALSDEEVRLAVEQASASGAQASLDDWGGLMAHLARIHPSRYGQLVDGLDLVAVTGVHELDDDMVGLRLVVLVDRLYDRDVPVRLGGAAVADLFSPRMLTKGYRKKYFRALSRLGALAGRPLP